MGILLLDSDVTPVVVAPVNLFRAQAKLLKDMSQAKLLKDMSQAKLLKDMSQAKLIN